MLGGQGNDTYVVNDLGDLIVEPAISFVNALDTVQSTVSYTLPRSVEVLELRGSQDINGTGNQKKNTLVGNAGDNVLDGKGRTDVMKGKRGNDTYVVNKTGDLVKEKAGQGIDTVLSSVDYTLSRAVENLQLTGTKNRDATGNALPNEITGNAGKNVINGKLGRIS